MRISSPSTSNIKNENNVNAMIMGIETESTKSQVNVPILINGVQVKALLIPVLMCHVSNNFSEQLKLNLEDLD